jgi:hypothetical protein
MAKNPYRKDDRVNVLESAVVFIDLLGVRASIAASTTLEQQAEAAILLRAALDDALPELTNDEADKYGEEYHLLKAKSFTDNIVVGIPLRSEFDADEGDLGSAFVDVAQFQLRMTLKGFLVRGAIDVGHLYVDDDMAWGSGLIAAVEAEHEKARDPRIVLTSDAVSKLYDHVAQYADVTVSPQFAALLLDWDGQVFVNYLAAIDELVGPAEAFLAEHRKVIVSGLTEYKHVPRVWPKYVWLTHYHNHFCRARSLPDTLLIDDRHVRYTMHGIPSIAELRAEFEATQSANL